MQNFWNINSMTHPYVFFCFGWAASILGKIIPDYCGLQSAIGSVKWGVKEGFPQWQISSRCSIFKFSNANKWEETWQGGSNTNPIKGILYLGSFVSFTKWLVSVIWFDPIVDIYICIFFTYTYVGGFSQQALTILQSNWSVLYIAFNFNLSTSINSRNRNK